MSHESSTATAYECYAFDEFHSTLTVVESDAPSTKTRASLEATDRIHSWTEISCRGQAEFRGAPIVFGLWFRVPDGQLRDFDRWYEEEHTPLLLDCADWWTVRRFAGSPAIEGINRLVLHYLGDGKALNSEERANARSTNMAKRFLAQEWFQRAGKHLLRRFHVE